MKRYEYQILEKSGYSSLGDLLKEAAADGWRLHSVIQGWRGSKTCDNQDPQLIVERELVEQ